MDYLVPFVKPTMSHPEAQMGNFERGAQIYSKYEGPLYLQLRLGGEGVVGWAGPADPLGRLRGVAERSTLKIKGHICTEAAI